MASRATRQSTPSYEYYDQQARHHGHRAQHVNGDLEEYPTHAHAAQTHAQYPSHSHHHLQQGSVMGYDDPRRPARRPAAAEEDYYYEDEDSGSVRTPSVESGDRRQHDNQQRLDREVYREEPSRHSNNSRPASRHSRHQYEVRSVPVTRMSQRMIPDHYRDDKDGSEIYVVDSAYTKGNDQDGHNYSGYNNNMMTPSIASTTNKSKTKAGVVIETMSAPNPFCPNTKGLCCLLVLINLGLILVTLGFSIVLQLFEPAFVWYCGILFLIVGFIALISSLVFLVHLCRESRHARSSNGGAQPGELYWTHHWQKRFSLPGAVGNPREDTASTIYTNEQDGRRSASRSSMPVHHSYRE